MAVKYSVVLATVPDEETGRSLARTALQTRLAACVNLVPGVQSYYWWEEKIEHAKEWLVVIKTRANLMPELTSFIRSEHPYSVPEVLALNVEGGNEDYLTWIGANTQFTRAEGRASAPTQAPRVDAQDLGDKGSDSA